MYRFDSGVCSNTAVAFLFGLIEVLVKSINIRQFLWNLIFCCPYFLKVDNVSISCIKPVPKFILFGDCPNSIYIPRNQLY